MPAGSGLIIPPAYLWVPEHSKSTAGPEAAEFAAEAGLELDGEQCLALDVILAERPDGRWAAFEAAVVAARQNLKTFVILVACLTGIYVHDVGLTVWTAHEFNTAMEAFRDAKELIDKSAFLSRRVKKIIEANGDEGIEFMSGQRFRFKARTKSGGRGLTGDRVVVDEAQELTAAHVASLMPTLSAKSVSGNPQLIYGGSAGFAYSEVWRNIRNRGRSLSDPSLSYIEYCAPEGGCKDDKCDHHFGIEGCVLDDVEKWRMANPALERRISIEFVAAERRSLPPAEFARERLGWWDEPDTISVVIPLVAWARCEDAGSQIDGDSAGFTLDVSPDQVSAAIGVVGKRADGLTHVEVIDHHPGVHWVVARAKELQDRWGGELILDPSGPAGALLDDLKKAGVRVREVTTREHTQACGAFYTAFSAEVPTGRHIGQPELLAAIKGAVKRPINDAWLWSRKNSTVDICPLVAVTLGFVGLAPPKPIFAY